MTRNTKRWLAVGITVAVIIAVTQLIGCSGGGSPPVIADVCHYAGKVCYWANIVCANIGTEAYDTLQVNGSLDSLRQVVENLRSVLR